MKMQNERTKSASNGLNALRKRQCCACKRQSSIAKCDRLSTPESIALITLLRNERDNYVWWKYTFWNICYNFLIEIYSHDFFFFFLILFALAVSHITINIVIIILARTAEIGQGLERILSCGAHKPEQTVR